MTWLQPAGVATDPTPSCVTLNLFPNHAIYLLGASPFLRLFMLMGMLLFPPLQALPIESLTFESLVQMLVSALLSSLICSALWWLIIIVKLIQFMITREMNVWVCL